MSTTTDQSDTIADTVKTAFADHTPLHICGGGTKAFLGETTTAEQVLDISGHSGIIQYEPGELVVTVRAGTPLAELEDTLAEQGQMLPFEPPHFGDNATIGGAIAAGLSGPARPFTGAARDFMLGCHLVNGQGDTLRLGGDVMKNVAGYDLSRLMAGAFGTLGVLLDVSLKVLPVPRSQLTLMHEIDAAGAIRQFNDWAGQPWPVTGACWVNGRSHLRLGGTVAAVKATHDALGGEALDEDSPFWRALREHQHNFFQAQKPLWRLSVAPATPLNDIDGIDDNSRIIDWGGAQRWLLTDADTADLRTTAADAGGHASVYRGDAKPRFHPLTQPIMALHRNVKNALDPADILNPGRLYQEL